MGKGYAVFWYYLVVILLALGPFVLQQYLLFPPFDQPPVIAAGVFALLLVFNPFLFAWFRVGPRFNIPFPPEKPANLEQTPAWLEIKKKNQELEAKARELQAKDLELTLANKQLQELERAKSDFVAVTTHQLRTPLSAIKWTLHMLLKDEVGTVSEEQKHFLKASLDSVERVITTVNELLTLDHIMEEKQDEFHLVATDLIKLIDGVMGEFAAPAKERQVSLVLKRPNSPLDLVELDPVKISMVMENLTDNAVKYSRPGGQVTVTLNDDKVNSARNIVEVIVSDTGIGIPEPEQGKIFQRFYRAANALKASPNGIGLGLYAAKDIIARHGGEIWFVSQEDRGTEFHFTLPLRQKPEGV